MAFAKVVQTRVAMDEGDSAHPIVYGLYADGDAKVASHQTLTSEAPPGQPSFVDGSPFKLSYDFSPRLEVCAAHALRDWMAAHRRRPEKLGVWIYGDAGGCQPRARFKEQDRPGLSAIRSEDRLERMALHHNVHADDGRGSARPLGRRE